MEELTPAAALDQLSEAIASRGRRFSMEIIPRTTGMFSRGDVVEVDSLTAERWEANNIARPTEKPATITYAQRKHGTFVRSTPRATEGHDALAMLDGYAADQLVPIAETMGVPKGKVKELRGNKLGLIAEIKRRFHAQAAAIAAPSTLKVPDPEGTPIG